MGLMLSGCHLPGGYRTVDTNETPIPATQVVRFDPETIQHKQHDPLIGHSNPWANTPVSQTGFHSNESADAAVFNQSDDCTCSQSCVDPPKTCCQTAFSQQFHQSLCGPPPALNFRSDAHNMWHTLVKDSQGLITWKNAAILGLATGSAISIRQDWDGKVRDYTEKNPSRWGNTGVSIGYLGDFSVQIPVLLGLYSYSLWDQNEPLHDLSGTLISAYAITTTTTTLIKVAVDSDRPSDDYNNGRFGFPSYHASSSFAMASVLDEYYGHKVGLPAYVLAGIIGWTRIDNRDHDLSDVVFGAVLGTVIGKSVARQHLSRNVDVMPYYDPQSNTAGVTIGIDY